MSKSTKLPVALLVGILGGLACGAIVGYITFNGVHDYLEPNQNDFWQKLVVFIMAFGIGAVAAVVVANVVVAVLMKPEMSEEE